MIERIKYTGQVFYTRSFFCVGCDEKMDITYETKQQLVEILEEEGWQRKGNKWYCPDCKLKGKQNE